MLSSKQLSVLVMTLASLQTSFAAPATEANPNHEIVPGPGLPTLESLGWNATYINSLPDPVWGQSSMCDL
jgi:hypothetical protein